MNATTAPPTPGNNDTYYTRELLLGFSVVHRAHINAYEAVTLATVAFGFSANILLLLAISQYRPLRDSHSYWLIMHCVLIDLYTTTVTVPNTALPIYLGPQHPLPASYCPAQSLVASSAYLASLHASCSLAIHRLTATIWPAHFACMARPAVVALLIAQPWLVALTLGLFPTLGLGIRLARSPITGICVTLHDVGPYAAYYAKAYNILGIYLPTAVTGISYLAVFVKTMLDVRRSSSSERPAADGHGPAGQLQANTGGHAIITRNQRRRREMARMLLLSFLWHCTTCYPMYVMSTFFQPQFAASFMLQIWLRYLSNAFCATNPVRVIKSF